MFMFTQFEQSLSRWPVIDTVHRFNATTNVVKMFELLMHIIEKSLFCISQGTVATFYSAVYKLVARQ